MAAQHLSDITAGELVERLNRSQIISLQPSTPLDESLNTLVRNRILSAPIFDPAKGAYTSFVDLADFLVFIDAQLHENEIIEGSPERLLHIVKRHRVADLANLSNRDPWVPTQRDTSLLNVASVMHGLGVHRIPIVDKQGSIQGLLSQSDVVRYVHDHLAQFPVLEQVTVQQSRHTPSVLSVKRSSPTVHAFDVMVRQSVSSLAVLNDDGTLFGNISLSDLKNQHFDMDVMHRARLSVEQYLQISGGVKRPVTVTNEDTLAHAVRLVVSHHIHRVYVVDAQGRPVGVLALRDILHTVLGH